MFFACGAALLVPISWLLFKVAPPLLAADHGLAGKDRAEEIGRTRTGLLAVAAGGLAVFGAIYTARTFALNRQAQITERFTRSVDQIGNRERVDVRLGGVYSLERLAQESVEDHGPIIEILSGYVREYARPQEVEEPTPTGLVLVEDGREVMQSPKRSDVERQVTKPATDVQAALTVIGRRNPAHDTDVRLSFQDVTIAGARLGGALLEGADFTNARLSDADLSRAKLARAVFSGQT